MLDQFGLHKTVSGQEAGGRGEMQQAHHRQSMFPPARQDRLDAALRVRCVRLEVAAVLVFLSFRLARAELDAVVRVVAYPDDGGHEEERHYHDTDGGENDVCVQLKEWLMLNRPRQFEVGGEPLHVSNDDIDLEENHDQAVPDTPERVQRVPVLRGAVQQAAVLRAVQVGFVGGAGHVRLFLALLRSQRFVVGRVLICAVVEVDRADAILVLILHF